MSSARSFRSRASLSIAAWVALAGGANAASTTVSGSWTGSFSSPPEIVFSINESDLTYDFNNAISGTLSLPGFDRGLGTLTGVGIAVDDASTVTASDPDAMNPAFWSTTTSFTTGTPVSSTFAVSGGFIISSGPEGVGAFGSQSLDSGPQILSLSQPSDLIGFEAASTLDLPIMAALEFKAGYTPDFATVPTAISQTVTESLTVTYDYTPQVSAAVPEPSTWALILIGFAGLGFAGIRKARLAASMT
jgi:hypothetical protein